MAGRADHFMPPALLASQLATLEVPTDALNIDIVHSPEEIVSQILERLGISQFILNT